MNTLIKQIALAVALIAPVASFAQSNSNPSNQPLTRSQVRAELLRVERAGYNPRDWYHYPENIQAAEQRASAQQDVAQADTSGYGPNVEGASQSGSGTPGGAVSPYSPPIHGRDTSGYGPSMQGASQSGRSAFDGAVSTYTPPVYRHP
jgi:hypothetical protein